MIRLLAIDPGLRHCGMALFEDGTMRTAWLSRTLEKVHRGPFGWQGMADGVAKDLIELGVLHDIHALAIEVPQVYQTKYQKGDQDDIIQLACAAGAVATQIKAKHKLAYLPRQWKGQVPKTIHNLRVVCRLTKEERERIDTSVANHLRNNVIDAIGIGIFTLAHQGTRTWGHQSWGGYDENPTSNTKWAPPEEGGDGEGTGGEG